MKNFNKPRVLIVDDEPSNINILAEILGFDYEIIVAKNGKQAIKQAISTHPPDLILLDIVMPDIDGYEVCRLLKTDKRTLDIPVIFITIKSEAKYETRGFKVGAVDYISKPFNDSVVKARVHTHLELRQHRNKLGELAEQRAKQLIHAERLATIGMLSAGIVHEINNALLYTYAYAEMLGTEFDRFSTYLTNCFDDKTKYKERCIDFFKKSKNFLASVLKGMERIESIAKSMRKFSYQDNQEKSKFCIEESIDNSLRLCHNMLKLYEIIKKKPNQKLPKLYGNARQLEQVFINIFKNAADAMTLNGYGKLEISFEHISSVIRITVEDTGSGIPADKLETIWEPFFTTKDSENGTGLGLSISKGIIEDHNGKIWAKNRTEGGTKFVIELPVSHHNN